MKKYSKVIKKIILVFLLVFFIFILSISILHKIFITPQFVQNQVIHIFKSSFNKEVKIEIKDISLFRGIELVNLILYNPSYSSRKIFIKINRIRIKYNLYYLFLFKVKVNEINIDHPYIFLEYNDKLKKWNFSGYIKPKKKKKKFLKKFSPLKIDIDLKKFTISNFSLEFIKNFYLKLSGINLFAKVKLDETSISGIETLQVKFFNTGKKNIVFNNQAVKVVLPLNLNLDFNIKNREQGKITINYDLKNQLVEFNKKFFTIPDIHLFFDSDLIIKDSQFMINKFLVTVNKNYLINLHGKIVKFDSAPEVMIAMQDNSLDLREFQNLLKLFLNQKNLNIKGIFTTSNFLFTKEAKKFPSLIGHFKLKNINFSLPDNELYLNDLNFSAGLKLDLKKNLLGNVNLNIKSITASFFKIKNFNLNSSVFIKSEGGIKIADLFIDNCKINNGDLLVKAVFNNNRLNGEIRLTDLKINKFNKSVYGKLNIINKFKNYSKDNYLNDFQMNIDDFKLVTKFSNQYYYSKKIPVVITSKQKFNSKKRNLDINFLNIYISDFIDFSFNGKYENNVFTGFINKFKIITQNIIDKLPENLAYNIPFQSVNGIINSTGRIVFKDKKLTVNIVTTNDRLLLDNKNSGFEINNLYSRLKTVNVNQNNIINYEFSISDIKNKVITFNTNIKNYEINYVEFLNKIELTSKVAADKNSIKIKKFNFLIPNINLDFNIAGKVITKPKMDIDLIARLNVHPTNEIHFLKEGKINGSLNLVSTIHRRTSSDSFLINGKVLFNKLSFYMKDIIIDKVHGYFPFRHIISKKKIDRKLLASKSVKSDIELLNYPLNRDYMKQPDNFTFKKIKIGDIEINNFAMDIEYNNNYLSLRKGYMELLDGSITINNSFFDMGNMEPETIRCKLNIEVSDIDIGKLRFIKIEEDEDTKIFANIRLYAKGIDFKKLANFENPGDISGSFNITHIGSEVAAKLLTAMDPNNKDGNVSLVKDLLYKGAWPELLTLELKYGQIFSKMWIDKRFYMIWMPMPPSPIEFKEKSIDEILQSFKKSHKG